MTGMPYFFTDQYDLGMEYVGNVGPDGYDDVVIRGDTRAEGGRTFTGVLARAATTRARGHARQRLGRHRRDTPCGRHLRRPTPQLTTPADDPERQPVTGSRPSGPCTAAQVEEEYARPS